MTSTWRFLGAALAITTGATLAACGSSSKKSTSATTASTAAIAGTTASTASGASTPAGATSSGSAASGAAATTITINNFTFPDKVTAAPGASVPIKNSDGIEHTVTADDGSFHVVVSGATATLTAPSKAGTYAYHCSIHTTMKGTLVVG